MKTQNSIFELFTATFVAVCLRPWTLWLVESLADEIAKKVKFIAYVIVHHFIETIYFNRLSSSLFLTVSESTAISIQIEVTHSFMLKRGK